MLVMSGRHSVRRLRFSMETVDPQGDQLVGESGCICPSLLGPIERTDVNLGIRPGAPHREDGVYLVTETPYLDGEDVVGRLRRS
jgi:hypothetical protein